MPIYEYRCEKGHTFEVMQRISDDPVAVCEEHGTPVKRVFHPVAVHFKGSGFYNTDYGKKKKGSASDGKPESSSSSSDSGKKSDSSGSSDSAGSSSGSGSGSGSGSKDSGGKAASGSSSSD